MPDKKTSWNKTGKLSAREREFIFAYVSKMPINEIAQRLKRSCEILEKFCQHEGLDYRKELVDLDHFDNDTDDVRELKEQLRRKNFYSEVKKTLLDHEEIRYFENRWVDYNQQFRGDLLATEEIQMKQMIVLDILMNRSLKDQKKHADSILELENRKMAFQEEKNPEIFLENMDKIANIEEQLANLRNSLGAYNKDIEKLLAKHNEILEKLKGTREQRVKVIEESKKNWTGLLKYLEEEDNRQFEGKHLSLMKSLVNQTRKELHEYYTYADKTVCPPVMTAESVITNERLDAEAQKKQETPLQEQT